MDSQDAPKTPKPPNSTKSYGQGVNDYFQYLPQFLQGEQDSRNQYDPQRIAEQQGLQQAFGPTQYAQMIQAFGQLDPQYLAGHDELGGYLRNNLANGTPQQGQAAGVTDYSLRNMRQGNRQMSGLISNLQNQYALGTQLSPSQVQEQQQQLRGSQAARGNASGTSAGVAEAYALGDRGQQMQQQRFTNLASGLGQQSQIGSQGLQNYLGAAGFQNALGQQNVSNMQNFLQGPSIAQQTNFVPPVSADRSSAYVNPNAGFQGQQFGLQNFQNALGAAQLGQGTGGNPWMSALGSVASIVGNLYGGGAFSDRRLKTDIHKVGKDDKGLNVYSFSYKGPKFIGHMADEVKEKFPDDVAQDPASGYYMVSQRFAPVQMET